MDIGGDSDAEDGLPVSFNKEGSSTRSDNSNISLESTVTSTPIASTSGLQHPQQSRKRIHFSDNDSSDSDIDPDYICSSLDEPSTAAEVQVASDSEESDDDNHPKSDNDSAIAWEKPNQKPKTFSAFKYREKFGPNFNVENILIHL